MRYKQLNLQERHYIELERKKGTFQKDIASALGRSCSTLCRELSRNTGQRGYRHIQANNKAFTRHKDKPKAIKLTNDIKTVISEYIEQDWSPEQVAGRLKKDDVISIHHETIYQYVLADKRLAVFCILILGTKIRPTGNVMDQRILVMVSPIGWILMNALKRLTNESE
ncbi:MAG: helix-turn-helix domain-containing protein [Ghiorsea sp.]|nr:helix-turn-helix domain-containing protein [Ghiorsea sp.]